MQATTLKLRRVRWGHRVMPAAIAFGLVLVLVFAFAHRAAAQNAGPQPPNNLNFDNNFFVTGDYAVGGVGMVGLANKVSPGYAVGTISMGADTNPGIAGANNSVPQGAEIVVALVYWQTIEIIGGATGQNGFFRPVFSGGPATGYAMQGTPLKNPNGTVYWDGTGCTTGKSSPKQLVTYVAVVTPYLRQDANGNVLAGYNNGNPQTKTAQNYEVMLPSQSNGAPLTLGATLVIIYRVMSPSFPLKSIVIYDGTFSPSSSLLTTTNNIQGFYQSDATASKLTYVVGNGQKNPSETVTLNGSLPLPSFYGSQPPFPGWYSGGRWDNVTWTFPNNNVSPPNPVTAGSSTATSWPSQSVPTVVTSAKAGCVTPAAVIFSTNVSDPENDGLPPVFKNSKGYCDAASGNGTGACTVGNASSGWVSLDDPTDEPQVGRKDMFVQLDYMVDASNHPLPLLSYSPANDYPDFATPNPIDSSGGDVNLGITRLKSALLGSAENLGPIKHNVHLHVFAGNVFQNYSGAITEQTCTDFVSVPGLCGFPAPDAGGYIGWKGNFTDIKNQLVLNGDPGSCTSTSPPASCQPRFQHGRKDSYHYVMLAHAPGLTQWFMSGGTLANVQQTSNAVTFTTSTSHGPLNAIGIVYQTSGGGLTTIDPTTGLPTGALPPLDPNCSNGRVTIGGAITNPNLNGTYCIQSVTDTTFTVNIGGSAATTTYTLATDPDLQVAPGYVSTTSGVSDEGGEDSLITLASWGPRATAKVIGGTIMHETGHSNALTHGGFTFPNAASGDYRPDVETNCKPNFQSVMSYTRQFDLLQYKTGDVVLLGIPLFPVLTDVVDYSEESLHNLVETTAGNPNVFPTAPFYFNTTWYRPSGVVGGTPSITHCDGTQITDGAQYSLLIGPANVNPPACLFCNSALSWNGGDDINFDGPTDASTLVSETLKGQNDWANAAGSINFDQVGATSSLSSTGGGIGAHGGGIGAHGGGIGVQGGGIGAHGGGIGVQGGGIGAHGGGIGAHGGGIGAHGAGEPSLYTTDSSGVHPPTSLSATEDVSPRTITLTWNKPTGTTVADRYKIYRTPAFASGSPLTVQASSLSCTDTQCTYVDTTDNCVPTGYTYAVSALQAPGTTNESVKSNSVNTTTAGNLLTGCYTNTPPTVTLNDLSFGLPNPAVHGSIVPITWTLQDDDTGAFVKTLAANTNKLSVIGPIAPTGGSCPATPPNSATTTLLSAGGFSATGNQFTVSWNTDTFSAGCYFARLDLDSGQPEKSASALQLGIDVNDTDSTPHIQTLALTAGTVGLAYSTTLTEDGGTAPFTWNVTGSFPTGISANSSTISGTTCMAGPYNLTATVTDSKSNSGTQALQLVINKANSTTGVMSNANPSVFQQMVTFTVTVAPQYSCTPTGTVTLYDGSTPIGSSSLTNGTATFAVSNLSVRVHSITASYGGDNSFNLSSSGVWSQTVNPAQTQIVVNSVSPSTAFVGQPITISYTFSVVAPGGSSPIAPSGSITVTASDGSLCAPQPASSGMCTLSPAPKAAGNVTFGINYPHDGNFLASAANSNYNVYQLVFTTQPSNTGVGLTITPAVVATAEDSGGGTLTTFTGGVTLAIGSGPGTLSGTTTQNAVSGVATFGDLSINKIANGYTLTASPTGGFPSATSNAFNVDTFYVDGNGNFGTLDLPTGTVTQIGAATVPASNGIDLTPGLQVYAYNKSNQLMQITPSTGAATLVGTGMIPDQATTGALTDGSYFGIDAVTGNLYSINLTTGATPSVGPTSAAVLPAGCTVEASLTGSANVLYYTIGYSGASCSSPMPDTLYQINPTSGATTTIGQVTVSGLGVNAFVGSAFVGGTLYGFTAGGQEYTINPGTGVATLLTSTTATAPILAAGSSQ